MTKSHQPAIREIFAVAKQIACPKKRAQYVRSMCDNAKQRDQIERLLAADHSHPKQLDGLVDHLSNLTSAFASEDGQAFQLWTETFAPQSSGTFDSADADAADMAFSANGWDPTAGTSQIGPYELLRRIGEGGVAIVYHARQTEPICRDVALKLLKPGMDSQQVLARFEMEREFLQQLKHSHIASILDAGMTATGHPYLVMELIDGFTIDEYCRRYQVPLTQRLRWICEVCDTVHHAHRMGIIHRDLKPSNLMVTRIDGATGVKVIDFGVAKAVTASIAQSHTSVSQLIGTPAYMSPEQADSNRDFIDTRSDVYAIGAILYTLIAGYPPIENRDDPSNGRERVSSCFFGREIERPSRRRLRLKAEEEKMAQQDGQETLPHDPDSSDATSCLSIRVAPDVDHSLNAIEYELDWVVLKALEHEPDRRYDSAQQLADDLRRFLTGHPVLAKRSSLLYVGRKLMLRHRFAIGLVSAAMLLLAITAGVAYWNRVKALAAEQKAVEQAGIAKERLENERQSIARLAAARQTSNDAIEAATLQQMLGAVQQQDYALLSFLQGSLPKHRIGDGSQDGSKPSFASATKSFSLFRLLKSLGQPEPAVEIEHPAGIRCLSVIAEGRQVATAGLDGWIRIWDLPTKTCVRKFGPSDEMRCVVVSPNAQLIAAGDGLGQIRLWNQDTGQLIAKKALWDSGVESMTWSPDGHHLAVGYRYGPVIVMNQEGDVLQQLNVDVDGHARNESVLFTPDGERLVTSRKHFGYQLWDWRSGTIIRQTPSKQSYPREMCWIGNEKSLLCAGNVIGELQFLDRNLQPLDQQVVEPDYPQAFASSADGTTLFIGNRNGTIACLHRQSNPSGAGVRFQEAFRFQAHASSDGSVTDLALLDEATLVSSGKDGRLCVWNSPAMLPKRESFADPMVYFAAAESGSALGVFGSDGDEEFQIVSMNLSEGTSPATKPLARVPEYYASQHVAFAPNGQFFGVVRHDAIELRRYQDGDLISEIPCDASAEFLQIFQDNQTVGFARDRNHYEIWRLHDQGRPAKRVQRFSGNLESAVIEQSQNRLLGRIANDVIEYSIDTAQILRRWDRLDYFSFAISQNGKWIALSSSGLLEIRHRESGDSYVRFPTHSMIEQLRFCDDSRILLSLHRDATVQAWHLPTKHGLGIVIGTDEESTPGFSFLSMATLDGPTPGLIRVSSRRDRASDPTTILTIGSLPKISNDESP